MTTTPYFKGTILFLLIVLLCVLCGCNYNYQYTDGSTGKKYNEEKVLTMKNGCEIWRVDPDGQTPVLYVSYCKSEATSSVQWRYGKYGVGHTVTAPTPPQPTEAEKRAIVLNKLTPEEKTLLGVSN